MNKPTREKMPKVIKPLINARETIRKAFSAHEWPAFAWLGLLAVLCYGILIPTLGFYWDDLPYLYQYAANGPSGFPAYVAPDRPFSAWIFMATTSLFGFNPIGYHLLALALRWLCAVLIYKICINLWHETRMAALITASASILYPGFSQQPIALIYNHHFSVFTSFLLSLYLMVLSVRRERRKTLFLILSLFFSLGMFSIENFSTLELIRPFILFKILREKKPARKLKDTITATLKLWLPFVAVFAAFLVWRVFIFSFPTYKPEFLDHLRENPPQAILALLARVLPDLFTGMIGAWTNTISLPTISSFGRAATYIFWIIIGFTLAAALFVLTNTKPISMGRSATPKAHGKPGIEMLTGALILFFTAGSLIWVLNLPVALEFSNNRLLLAFIPASALFFGGIYALFSRKSTLPAVIIAFLFTMAAGTHFQNGMAYKRDWEQLQIFLSQLSWRVPALQENTMLITSETGLRFYSDSSLTSPVNLMYNDELESSEYPHLVYTTYSPRTVTWFENEIPNADYERADRSFVFRGNSENVLSYLYRPPGCLQVLDSTYSNAIAIANLTDLQVKEIRFSNLNVVARQPQAQPFASLFSAASEDTWCYFFERADLARQFQDHATISGLGDRAIDAGYRPRIASEWLPFLEGYLWLGDWERAGFIINEINNAEDNYRSGMCYTLRRVTSHPDYPFPSEGEALLQRQDCD